MDAHNIVISIIIIIFIVIISTVIVFLWGISFLQGLRVSENISLFDALSGLSDLVSDRWGICAKECHKVIDRCWEKKLPFCAFSILMLEIQRPISLMKLQAEGQWGMSWPKVSIVTGCMVDAMAGKVPRLRNYI